MADSADRRVRPMSGIVPNNCQPQTERCSVMFKKLKARVVPLLVGTAMVAAPVGFLGSCEQIGSAVMEQIAPVCPYVPPCDGGDADGTMWSTYHNVWEYE